jgi:photosystem II stability/assembly factor-like uncharacterized protein
MKRIYPLLASVFFVLLLLLNFGYGGGGGGSNETPQPSPTPAPPNPLDNWTVRLQHVPFSAFSNMAWGNGIYVFVGGNGKVVTSTDQISWTIRNSGTTNNLNSIAFGKNIFVAVGEHGIILTSADGITWTKKYSRTPSRHATCGDIAFGGNSFVVVTDVLLTSPDGTNWVQRQLGSLPVSEQVGTCGVTFGNGSFFVVRNSTIYQSDPLY